MLTQSAFLAFYPQFSSFTPGIVLTEYLAQANARFSDFGEDAEEARRLFTAHKLTLYAAACLPEGAAATKEQIAASGRSARQAVSSKKVGEVAISYSTESLAAASASTGLSDLKETAFGLQLLSLLRLHTFPEYIP